MAYVKTVTEVGDRVILTEKKESCAGYFEVGTIVTIVDIDNNRGYSFKDDLGNYVYEAGFGGFQRI